jgi:hypothetical protein
LSTAPAGLHPVEAGVSTYLYQMSLYSISRLVRRGFTLGELCIASSSGVALCLEFGRLTVARVCPFSFFAAVLDFLIGLLVEGDSARTYFSLADTTRFIHARTHPWSFLNRLPSVAATRAFQASCPEAVPSSSCASGPAECFLRYSDIILSLRRSGHPRRSELESCSPWESMPASSSYAFSCSEAG